MYDSDWIVQLGWTLLWPPKGGSGIKYQMFKTGSIKYQNLLWQNIEISSLPVSNIKISIIISIKYQNFKKTHCTTAVQTQTG